MKVVRTFEVEYDESLGRDWLCLGNLMLCLLSKQCVGVDTLERVEEISVREVNEDVQRWKSSVVEILEGE